MLGINKIPSWFLKEACQVNEFNWTLDHLSTSVVLISGDISYTLYGYNSTWILFTDVKGTHFSFYYATSLPVLSVYRKYVLFPVWGNRWTPNKKESTTFTFQPHLSKLVKGESERWFEEKVHFLLPESEKHDKLWQELNCIFHPQKEEKLTLLTFVVNHSRKQRQRIFRFLSIRWKAGMTPYFKDFELTFRILKGKVMVSKLKN